MLGEGIGSFGKDLEDPVTLQDSGNPLKTLGGGILVFVLVGAILLGSHWRARLLPGRAPTFGPRGRGPSNVNARSFYLRDSVYFYHRDTQTQFFSVSLCLW